MSRLRTAGFRAGRAWFHASGKDAINRGGLVSGFRELWGRFTAFLRMLRAWASGQYKIPAGTLLFVVLALVYFLSPIDVIPDFIPALGLLDDATVVLLLLGAVQKDVDRFQSWEEQQQHTIDAENPASAVS